MKKITMIALLLISVLTSCKKEPIEEPLPTSQPTQTYSPPSSNSCSSSQCTAIAVSTNQRCKNMTTNCIGLCHVHD